jgi:hypothetical protein
MTEGNFTADFNLGCRPVRAYAQSWTGAAYGFNWTDTLPPGFTITSLRMDMFTSLNCNGATREARLNGVSVGQATFSSGCSGCGPSPRLLSMDLTPFAASYAPGGSNTMRFILNWVNFEGITTNPAWGPGVYARIVIE